MALYAQFRRRKADISLEREGWEFYYAIDNDVTTTITAPWLDEGAQIFGPLFAATQDAYEGFANVFAEYIFSRDPRNPLLLIPPANNELEGQWNSVFAQASAIMSSIEEHFTRLLDDAGNELNSATLGSEYNLFDTIRSAVQIIHGGRTPATELRRIARLLESGSIRRIDAFRANDGFPICSFVDEDDPEFKKLEQGWRQRLKAKRPKRPSSNMVDAAVLARIESINLDYRRRGEKRRLCLITGDANLFEAASENVLENGVDFSVEFLRRPTAFIVDEEFFAGVRSPYASNLAVIENECIAKDLATNIANWFKEIAKITPMERRGSSATRYNHLIESISEARSNWSDYLQSAGLLYTISPEEITGIAQSHIKAARYLHRADVVRVFEDLRNDARAVGQEANIRFTVAGALSRFWSVDIRISDVVDRLVPPVRFNSYQFAESTASEILVRKGKKLAEMQLSKKWLSCLEDEDDTKYTTMLIFALAFSALGEWRTALHVAQAAYAIARMHHGVDLRSPVKGDEAAYLCAVFARMSARSIGELSRVSSWLDEADRARLEEPLRVHVDRSNPTPEPRFQAEHLALRVTRRFFAHYQSSDDDSQFASAMAGVVDSFSELAVANRDLFNAYEWGEADVRMRYVYLQLLVNAVQCSILANQPFDFDDEVNGKFRAALLDEVREILGRSMRRDKGADRSRLRSRFSELVILLGGLSFRSGEFEEVQIQEMARLALERASDQDSFPYGKAKRNDLFKCAGFTAKDGHWWWQSSVNDVLKS